MKTTSKSQQNGRGGEIRTHDLLHPKQVLTFFRSGRLIAFYTFWPDFIGPASASVWTFGVFNSLPLASQ